MSQKRVYWMGALLGGAALAHLGGVIAVARLPGDLIAQTTLSRPLEIGAGLVWALAFGAMSVRVWRKTATWLQVWVLWSVFGLYTLLRLALLARADYDRGRLAAVAVGCASVLLITVWVYSRQRLATPYLKENNPNGPEPEN